MNDPRASGSSAVLDAEQARTGAMVAGDVDTLDRLLDDECLYVHSSGAIDTKTAYLDRLRDGTLIYRSVRTSGHRVYALGQGCAVSHRMDAEVILHGVPRPYQGQVIVDLAVRFRRIAADLPAGDNDPRRIPMTDAPSRTAVLISGGGPVGLSAAVELGLRGIDCRAGRAATRADPNPATSEDAQRQDHGAPAALGPGRPAARAGAAAHLVVARTWRSAPACWVDEITRFHGVLGLAHDDVSPELGQQEPQYVYEGLLREVIADLSDLHHADRFAASADWTRRTTGSTCTIESPDGSSQTFGPTTCSVPTARAAWCGTRSAPGTRAARRIARISA